jgi:hypothetical protein
VTAKLSTEDFKRAERSRARQQDNGLTFRSVRHALQWHYEARDRVSSGAGVHPRGQRAANGQTVVISVDGGRSVERDEVLATLSTIHGAIEGAAKAHPEGMRWLARQIQGESQADIAKLAQKPQSSISVAIGKAEAYIRGALDAGKVLR